MFSLYEITNSINGKKYIGITSRNVEARFDEHKSRARCGRRKSRLYAAMRKHGVENFSVVLVDNSDNEDRIREMETVYIKERDSYRNGYNCNLGGNGHLVLPDEVKEKIGDANRGRVVSKAAREKMSMAKRGDSSCSNNFGDYTKKGDQNPKAKGYIIQTPSGEVVTVIGLRAFCRKNGIKSSSGFQQKGKAKGFILLGRSNDYPFGEYAQAGGSAHLPTR